MARQRADDRARRVRHQLQQRLVRLDRAPARRAAAVCHHQHHPRHAGRAAGDRRRARGRLVHHDEQLRRGQGLPARRAADVERGRLAHARPRLADERRLHRHLRQPPRHRAGAQPRPGRAPHPGRAAVPVADRRGRVHAARGARCACGASRRAASRARPATRWRNRSTTPRRSAAAARSWPRTIRTSTPSAASRASTGATSSSRTSRSSCPSAPTAAGSTTADRGPRRLPSWSLSAVVHRAVGHAVHRARPRGGLRCRTGHQRHAARRLPGRAGGARRPHAAPLLQHERLCRSRGGHVRQRRPQHHHRPGRHAAQRVARPRHPSHRHAGAVAPARGHQFVQQRAVRRHRHRPSIRRPSARSSRSGRCARCSSTRGSASDAPPSAGSRRRGRRWRRPAAAGGRPARGAADRAADADAGVPLQRERGRRGRRGARSQRRPRARPDRRRLRGARGQPSAADPIVRLRGGDHRAAGDAGAAPALLADAVIAAPGAAGHGPRRRRCAGKTSPAAV